MLPFLLGRVDLDLVNILDFHQSQLVTFVLMSSGFMTCAKPIKVDAYSCHLFHTFHVVFKITFFVVEVKSCEHYLKRALFVGGATRSGFTGGERPFCAPAKILPR